MTLSFGTITSLPTAPQKTDPTSFVTRADAFVAALDTLQSQLNTLITELNSMGSALDTEATVPAWSSGSTYALYDVVYSQTDAQTYISVAGSNTNHDPFSDDGTWWRKIGGSIDFVYAYGSVSGTININATVGDTITFTLTNTGTITPQYWPIGRTVSLIITNGGAYTLNWPTGTKWPGGSPPDLTQSGVDRVVIQRVGASEYHAVLAGMDFS